MEGGGGGGGRGVPLGIFAIIVIHRDNGIAQQLLPALFNYLC